MNQNDELNNLLLQQYHENLTFFKENFDDIFEIITNLDSKINSGDFIENYHLEFIDSSYFNIFDSFKNEYLYKHNTFNESQARVNNINLDSKNTINLLRKDDSNKFSIFKAMGNSAELVKYINKHLEVAENPSFKKIYKFIYIGVGLGIHLSEINKKINSMNTLIIEPDIEIFRLSMFLVNYKEFQKDNKKLFISIGDNEVNRRICYQSFINHHPYMNHTVKHHLQRLDCEYILDDIISYFRQTPLDFSYNSVLETLNRTIKFIKNKERFIKYKLLQENLPLKNKKVLIIAAGPSVDKNIEFVRKNKEKFIIICVDKILQKLEKEQIVPDLVLSIDPCDKIKDFFQLKNQDFLKDSSILLLSQQEDALIDIIKELNYYFIQPLRISKELEFELSTPNVGIFSVIVAICLGSKEIYTLGTDAAFDVDTGKTYAEDTLHKMIDNLPSKAENKLDKSYIDNSDTIEVKGNLVDKVITNYTLIEFKYDFENIVSIYRKQFGNDFEIYNLSNGAYIEGFIPKDPLTFDCQDFKDKNFSSIDALNKITTKIDNFDTSKDKNKVINIIKKLKSTKKNIFIKNDNDFQDKKLSIQSWILQELINLSNDAAAKVFMHYSALIDIYLNYTLNLENSINSDKEFLTGLYIKWIDCSIDLNNKIKEVLSD